MTRRTARACATALALASAAAAPAQDGGRPADRDGAQPFPHIRVDPGARTVEFDGTVPITLDDPEAPDVYLEVIVCTPDTKEHEALVVTPARPSHVHAALLLLGIEPGQPGKWRWREDDTLVAIPPEGPPLTVELIYTDQSGDEVVDPAWRWVKNVESGETLPGRDWLFAGSRYREWRGREVYDADGTGVLVGLTTFGSEVVAYPEMYSHESSVEEPVWVADPAHTPPMGTEVTVRLSVAQD